MRADEGQLLVFTGTANDGAHGGVKRGAVGEWPLRRRRLGNPRRVLEDGADDAGKFLATETVYFIERNAHAVFVIAAANALKLFVVK